MIEEVGIWSNVPLVLGPFEFGMSREPLVEAIDCVLVTQESLRQYREDLQTEFDLAEPH